MSTWYENAEWIDFGDTITYVRLNAALGHIEKQDAEITRLRQELAELRALELNHEGACVRLKAERDAAITRLEKEELSRELNLVAGRERRLQADFDQLKAKLEGITMAHATIKEKAAEIALQVQMLERKRGAA